MYKRGFVIFGGEVAGQGRGFFINDGDHAPIKIARKMKGKIVYEDHISGDKFFSD